MKAMLLVALVASVMGAAVVDMCKDEARTRLGRLPVWLIRLAAKRVPRGDRAELRDEWTAELTFILRGTEGLPVTRLIRGIAYSADLLFRGAPRVAREIKAEMAAAPTRATPTTQRGRASFLTGATSSTKATTRPASCARSRAGLASTRPPTHGGDSLSTAARNAMEGFLLLLLPRRAPRCHLR